MEDVAGPAPAAKPGDAVMVLSVWTEGAPGGFLARMTMTGAGHEPRVRAASRRQQVHDVVDEWLDELIESTPPAKPRT